GGTRTPCDRRARIAAQVRPTCCGGAGTTAVPLGLRVALRRRDMRISRTASWSVAVVAAMLSLGCTGADGKQGPPGPAGHDGDAGVAPPLRNDVSGTVTDGQNPLEGVTVEAAPGNAMAMTDASGGFSLPGLDVGAYLLTFHLAGYVDRTVEVAVNLSGPTSVS